MRSDPETHGDNSISAETDDPLGARYQVRVWLRKDSDGFGVSILSPFNRPEGVVGRVVQRLLRVPQTAPDEEWFRVFARPVAGTNGLMAHFVRAKSLNEALLRGLEMLEDGSFPKPGEPTHL